MLYYTTHGIVSSISIHEFTFFDPICNMTRSSTKKVIRKPNEIDSKDTETILEEETAVKSTRKSNRKRKMEQSESKIDKKSSSNITESSDESFPEKEQRTMFIPLNLNYFECKRDGCKVTTQQGEFQRKGVFLHITHSVHELKLHILFAI